MRAPLVAAALLLATVAPPAGADVLSPLLPLVDAAAQRLQTADPVAAAKYLTGGAISDPPREQQVLDGVAAAAQAQGADPGYVREVFRDQIDATVSLQHSLFAYWKIDPAAAPVTAPDLAATRAKIDALNQTMVTEIAQRWQELHDPSCPAERDAAITEASVNRGLDPVFRRALEYATHDYCR
ncbi:chorismate mutase [Mycolicibacterium bacteremicum]|uniref:Chorismate mutase n=1 Tax=Mycolicibacterium bacteremicum TaxID=564198 RepID=A0A1W9YQ38_MYCBA|nr:chorismate mutase [Mycolicibacterium bacteremicum]MCV7434883.1 chorismate mutase [Mycolicibacterium bacteremicum]ORA02176.1 chorismate mutase [Mycolicibacterium bacteremicum]